MREFKFRVWANKQMFPVAVMDVARQPAYYFKPLHGWSEKYKGSPITGHLINRDDCDFKFMQYTGLRDMNGVEIYEGDICRTANSMVPQVVEYMNQGGYPAFDLTPGWEDDLNHISREWHEGTLDVIGNIYENPELLAKA